MPLAINTSVPGTYRRSGRLIRIGGATFSPSQLSNLVQRFLDANPTYSATVLQSYPILTPEETGTVAVPRGQRCASFDGTNDYGALGARLTNNSTKLTFCCWAKTSTAGALSLGGEWSGTNSWVVYMNSGNNLEITITGTGGTYIAKTTAVTLNDGAWHHLAVAVDLDNDTIVLAIDGVSRAVTNASGTISTVSALAVGTDFRIGVLASSLYWNGSMRDVRVYSVAKSPTEIAAIYNQASTPSTIDTTGLLGMWPLQEESGTTAYDVSGNGKHLTLTNITQATFHATDSGVTYNVNNWKGHTVSGSVVIPASLSTPSQDAAGNALGVTGPVAHPATMEVPCVTGDGSAAYCDLGSALIANGATSFVYECCVYLPTLTTTIALLRRGNTTNGLYIDTFTDGKLYVEWYTAGVSSFQTVTLSSYFTAANWARVRIDYDASRTASDRIRVYVNDVLASLTVTNNPPPSVPTITGNLQLFATLSGGFTTGRICDLQITTGGVTTYFPMQEGSTTSRDLYYAKSDGTGGKVANAIVNGTIATIRANRCPYAKDWAVQYGGGTDANSAFVPGLIGGANDANGAAKTLSAGKHGNPYSRICPNTWSAPELVNIGYTSSTKLAPTDTVQATSPADTKFRRNKTDGSDRYFATLAALTSTDLTNANSYVG